MFARTCSLALSLALLVGVGCTPPADTGNTDDANGEDEDPGPPPPDDIAELSDGECPDMSESGITSFSSGGLSRKVGVVLPDDLEDGLPLVINFHGLTTAEYQPVENTASALQQEADNRNAVFLVPEALEQTTLIGDVLFWGIRGDEEPDLTLFDDLRTCASQQLNVDLSRMSVWGMSGGALWATKVLLERSGTLASVVEFSGGAEIDDPTTGDHYLTYETPEHKVPIILATGGDQDVWPQGFPIVDFTAATEALQASLVADEHLVIRCIHSQGHAVPQQGWVYSHDWMLEHQFGVPSPTLEDGIGDQDDWCEVLEAEEDDSDD